MNFQIKRQSFHLHTKKKSLQKQIQKNLEYVLPYRTDLDINDAIRSLRDGEREDYDQQSIDYYIVHNRDKMTKKSQNLLAIAIMQSNEERRSKQQLLFLQSYFQKNEYFKDTSINFNENNFDLFRYVGYKKFDEFDCVCSAGNEIDKVFVCFKGQSMHFIPNKNYNWKFIQNKIVNQNMFLDFQRKLEACTDDYHPIKQEAFENLSRISKDCNINYQDFKQQIQKNEISDLLFQILFLFDNTKNLHLKKISESVNLFRKNDIKDRKLIHLRTVFAMSTLEVATIPKKVFMSQIYEKTILFHSNLSSLIKQCPGFRILDNDLIQKLCNCSQIRNCQKGDVICEQDKSLSYMYMVMSAEVQIIQNNQTQTYFKKHKTFGEEICVNKPSLLTCIVSKPGTLIFINIKEFFDDLEDYPEIVEKIISSISATFILKFKKNPNGKMQFIQKIHYSIQNTPKIPKIFQQKEISKSYNKKINDSDFIVTPPVKDLYTTSINKMNKFNQSPQFNVIELDNYFIMKTKYFSPPNFTIFQHQAPLGFQNTKKDFESKLQKQQKQYATQINNRFFKDIFLQKVKQDENKIKDNTSKISQDFIEEIENEKKIQRQQIFSQHLVDENDSQY